MNDRRQKIEDVPFPYSHHPFTWFGTREAKPVGSEPELPDWSPKHFDCYATAAEASARTASWMIHNAPAGEVVDRNGDILGTYRWIDTDDHFLPRIASDRRIYLLGALSVTLGLLVMLGTIGLYLHRPTPSHVTLDDRPYAAWCMGFAGTSCCYDSRYAQTSEQNCVDVNPHR